MTCYFLHQQFRRSSWSRVNGDWKKSHIYNKNCKNAGSTTPMSRSVGLRVCFGSASKPQFVIPREPKACLAGVASSRCLRSDKHRKDAIPVRHALSRGQTLFFDLETLFSGQNRSVVVRAKTLQTGLISNGASVSATERDTNTANNAASALITVSAASA